MSIDWLLLAKQKATLIDLCINGLLTKSQVEDLDSLVHLMDALQDEANKPTFSKSGDGPVFPPGPAGYIDENGAYVMENVGRVLSAWKPGPNWKKLVRGLVTSADAYMVAGFTVIDTDELRALQTVMPPENDD